MDRLLPAKGNVAGVEHHAALPWQEVPAFLVEVRAHEATAARALEFAILTATRTGEVLGARWSEVDLAAKVWTIPASRMKANREHRVPLSTAALAILEQMHPLCPEDGDGYVFPGQRPGKPLSQMAMLMLLRRMKRENITVHGFRSIVLALPIQISPSSGTVEISSKIRATSAFFSASGSTAFTILIIGPISPAPRLRVKAMTAAIRDQRYRQPQRLLLCGAADQHQC